MSWITMDYLKRCWCTGVLRYKSGSTQETIFSGKITRGLWKDLRSLVKFLVHEGLQMTKIRQLYWFKSWFPTPIFCFNSQANKKKILLQKNSTDYIHSKFFLLLSCCVGSGLSSEDVCRHVAVGSQLFHHQKDLHVVFMKDAFSNTVQDGGEI